MHPRENQAMLLTKREWPVLVVNLIYLPAFTVVAYGRRNFEFVMYALVVVTSTAMNSTISFIAPTPIPLTPPGRKAKPWAPASLRWRHTRLRHAASYGSGHCCISGPGYSSPWNP